MHVIDEEIGARTLADAAATITDDFYLAVHENEQIYDSRQSTRLEWTYGSFSNSEDTKTKDTTIQMKTRRGISHT